MIKVESLAPLSARATQLRGLFDIPATPTISEQWDPTFVLDRPWHIGLITGPSGCGKSTIATHLFSDSLNVADCAINLCPDKPVIDSFPAEMSLRDITQILSAVGFSSPPSWLKPAGVLSTGQLFRAEIALALASADGTAPILCDEFTSVVDRTVAQIGSAAIARTVRARNLQFIAVTCHPDVEDWLQPNWIYLPAENRFSWRSLRPRPTVTIDILRCHASAWPLFAPHHYLTATLNTSAKCWCATIRGTPVAFTSWLPFFGPGPPTSREHRTVCLPDYQGIGIGNALSATIASMFTALGRRATSTTTHPGMITSRNRNPLWLMHRPPSLARHRHKAKHATTRLTAGFTYVGPPMKRFLAEALNN